MVTLVVKQKKCHQIKNNFTFYFLFSIKLKDGAFFLEKPENVSTGNRTITRHFRPLVGGAYKLFRNETSSILYLNKLVWACLLGLWQPKLFYLH